MPPATVFTKKTNPAGFPDVTHDRPLPPQLPDGLNTVAALGGRIAVAHVAPARLPHVARHLLCRGVQYYWPRKVTRRTYADLGVTREWESSLFAGTMFVAGGNEGQEVTTEFAAFFGWRVTWRRPGTGAAQNRLRKDLQVVQNSLAVSPTVEVWESIRPGIQCRVKEGPFEGRQGWVLKKGEDSLFQVELQFMGDVLALKIAPDLLEPI